MPTNTFKVGEMLNKRTPNSKTWINFDGSYTTEIHMSNVHFDDVDGNLHNINTDLFDEADFDVVDYPVAKEGAGRFNQSRKEAIEAKQKGILNRENWNFQGLRVPFECHIPRNFMRGYTIGKGADKLTFKPIKSSPSKGHLDVNDRSVITYQDVWNDTDVQLKVLDKGIKESIFLKSDRSPSSFSFEVVGNIDNLTELKLADAWLIDNMGTKRDVEQIIRTEDNKSYVDLVADLTGLVYPIEIDPTVTVSSPSQDSHINKSEPDMNFGTDTQLWTQLIDTHERNALIQFDLSGVPTGVVITKANVIMRVSASNDSGDMQVYENNASWSAGTVTWNTRPSRSYVGTQTAVTSGEQYFNVKSTVQKHSDGVTKYGWTMRTTATERRFYSMEYSTDAYYEPRLEVEYNHPPTAPTVNAPNGGETWNSLHNIQWSASTDTDTDDATLKYQIQLSVDDGVTFYDIVALTAQGVTNYDYDFINEPESSTCLIRIRAYDGTSYGEWDQSDGVFTIQHNRAPNTPTNLSPDGGVYDKATVIRFSWQHNDSDGDPQAQFDLRWRLQGASTWNMVTQATTNQYYDMPENTLPDGSIEWQVRTYDQEGLSSSYSSALVFKTSNKPSSPTITAPTDGATVAVANPTVEWSSVGQTDYHVKVLSSSSSLLWEIIKTSNNKAQTIQYDLANLTDYKIQVAIKNADGLWSDFASVNISVSYTPPATPTVTTSTDTDRGYVRLDIVNPTPVDTEPNVDYNNVFRRISGGEWERIAVNITGIYTDYTIASGKTYEYKVRAWGTNGTFSDSLISSESVSISHAQLALVSDFATWAEVKLNPQRKESQSVNRQMMQFAGRKHAVAEFGEHHEFDLGLSFIVFDIDQLNILRDLVNSRETLLYRDNRGRKAFVTIDSLNIVDEQPNYYSVKVQPNIVSYTEVV